MSVDLPTGRLARLDALVDPGTFREFGSQARHRVTAFGMAGKRPAGDGVITGSARIDGKYVQPAWSPPDEVRRDNPRLPDVIPGGTPGNPMGARALTLDRDQYAIHGTNRPDSIGTSASYGCIRMHNRDVVDLFDRVSVGTTVVVTQ